MKHLVSGLTPFPDLKLALILHLEANSNPATSLATSQHMDNVRLCQRHPLSSLVRSRLCFLASPTLGAGLSRHAAHAGEHQDSDE